MLLASCAKEPPIATTVEVEAACTWCDVKVTHGTDVSTVTVGGGANNVMARYTATFTAATGDQVEVVLVPLDRDAPSALISIKVDGHVQGFRYLLPEQVRDGVPISYTFTVPELDKWGSPK